MSSSAPSSPASPESPSESASTAQAVHAAMLNASATHAMSRGGQFYTAMREYAALSADTRPLLTPAHTFIAEILGNIAVLMAVAKQGAEAAVLTTDVKALVYFTDAQITLEHAGKIISELV